MVVVELFVHVADPRFGKPLREDPGAVVDVVLVAPAAVDVDAGIAKRD
jgi:hypothetical protein